jgi:hypothetical protein
VKLVVVNALARRGFPAARCDAAAPPRLLTGDDAALCAGHAAGSVASGSGSLAGRRCEARGTGAAAPRCGTVAGGRKIDSPSTTWTTRSRGSGVQITGAVGDARVGGVGGVGGTSAGATTRGGSGGVGAIGVGAVGGGREGGITGAGITGVISGDDTDGALHIPPRFQFQTHPWTPVSIAWVIPPPVISAQLHVQFQVHVDGVVGAAAEGDPAAQAVPAAGATSDGPGSGLASGLGCG